MASCNQNTHLHPNNRHKQGYNLEHLCQHYPELQDFLIQTPAGTQSIDFKQAKAITALNTAILLADYQIKQWTIPQQALCPGVPGRADYLHYLTDFLTSHGANKLHGRQAEPAVNVLDIGTGASGIYALLASRLFNWQVVASDISSDSLSNVEHILLANPDIKRNVQLRHQPDKHAFFTNIIQPDEHYDFTLCNPPFFASEQEAQQANRRKNANLKLEDCFNFSGQANELYCNGGEKLFIKKMIKESVLYSKQVTWFSSLVSQAANLKPLTKQITKNNGAEVKTLSMQHGNKISHILLWRFKSTT